MQNLENNILKINDHLANINRKGYGHYEISDLIDVHKEMEAQITYANNLYKEHILNVSTAVNSEIYKLISKYSDKKKYYELLTKYNELTYSFRSAYEEITFYARIDNISDYDILEQYVPKTENMKMIQLCKNVRIMEDLIDKICNNNIDKSIVKGDHRIESVKYGFQWLFCNSSETYMYDSTRENLTYKNIDIRDKYRYLDFIKYQIMVSGRNLECGPKTASDIDTRYFKISSVFDNKIEFKDKKKNYIDNFKKNISHLIDVFFEIYTLLVEYRDNLFMEEDIRRVLDNELIKNKNKSLNNNEKCEEVIENSGQKTEIDNSLYMPSSEIVMLSFVALRVLTDRFVSFVKISDLNFGNSTFNRAWFNYSELSNSNYAGTSFKHARMENALIKNCDLSTCNFSYVDASGTDFTGSNFNYSNMTGINLKDSVLNFCQIQNAVLRDTSVDMYKTGFLDNLFNIDQIRSMYSDKLSDEIDSNVLVDTEVYNKEKDNLTKEDIKLIDEFENVKKDYLIFKNLWETSNVNTVKFKEDIISFLMSIEFSDIKNDEYPIEILDFSISSKNRKRINELIKKYIISYTEKIIPSSVLARIEKLLKMENENSRRNREEVYGKIRIYPSVLTNTTAKNVQMSNMDFSHITMTNASFEDADLSGADMYYTTANGASFIRSNLNNSNWFESDFHMANFSNAIINNAEFVNCNLKNTNWNKSILINSLFVDASNTLRNIINSEDKEFRFYLEYFFNLEKQVDSIISTKLNDYVLPSKAQETYWQNECTLNESKIENALVDNATFINIIADKASFNKSSLKNCFMANCSMHLSDLINVDFRYVYIVFSSFGSSNISESNITMAKVLNSEFCNANLSNSLLNSSFVNRVLFKGSNLSNLNLTNATIKNSAFISCDIDGMIIQNTTFENCVFEDILFENIIASHSASFINCKCYHCLEKSSDQFLQKKFPNELEWIDNGLEY